MIEMLICHNKSARTKFSVATTTVYNYTMPIRIGAFPTSFTTFALVFIEYTITTFNSCLYIPYQTAAHVVKITRNMFRYTHS